MINEINEIIENETSYQKRCNEPDESAKNYYNLAVPTEKSLKISYQSDGNLYNNNYDKQQLNKIKELFAIRNNKTINEQNE